MLLLLAGVTSQATCKHIAMSAILSADDLNDFISPGVACIKPVETLPAAPATSSNTVNMSLSALSQENMLINVLYRIHMRLQSKTRVVHR